MAEIYKRKNKKAKDKEEWAYYDKATKKTHTGSFSRFPTEKDFKHYIQAKGFIFGYSVYKGAVSPVKQGVNYDFIESKKIIKGKHRFVINGETTYKKYKLYGSSAPNRETSAERIREAKEQVKSSMAQQIMRYTNPARYNEEFHDDDYYEDIEDIASSIDDSKINYTITYSKEK